MNKLNTGDILLCHWIQSRLPDPGLDGLKKYLQSPWENIA